MLNILHITTGLNLGGAENFLKNLVLSSSIENWSHEIICLRGETAISEAIRAEGIAVQCLDAHGYAASATVLAKLFRIARLKHWAVFKGWMYHGNLAATLMKFFCRSRPALETIS